ncbi:hypothetical protein ACFQV2_35940 [Actinokineospora soli]|uniref:Secreted protein n=1 Tax=Actinokineospora soli TaxID=1048753 RepID=A0ABW2TVT1_9PSEU
MLAEVLLLVVRGERGGEVARCGSMSSSPSRSSTRDESSSMRLISDPEIGVVCWVKIVPVSSGRSSTRCSSSGESEASRRETSKRSATGSHSGSTSGGASTGACGATGGTLSMRVDSTGATEGGSSGSGTDSGGAVRLSGESSARPKTGDSSA